jgi:hypothetical protein
MGKIAYFGINEAVFWPGFGSHQWLMELPFQALCAFDSFPHLLPAIRDQEALVLIVEEGKE